jgi:hypothetical protein
MKTHEIALTRLLLVSLLSVGFLATAAEENSASSNDRTSIGYKSPQAALVALRMKPGVTEREENDWIVLNDKDDNTIWSITTDAHLAHPTAVKRALVARDGGVYVEMGVLCGASKDVCDHVVMQFQEINDNLRRSFEH